MHVKQQECDHVSQFTVHVEQVTSYMPCCPLMMFYCFFVVDWAGDLSALKEKSFTLQEGVKYRLKIHFKVSWKDAVIEVY